MVDNKLLPLRFHTFKLRDTCRKWSPCEIEALALATAVEIEFDLLRKSKLPIIVCPDNKPVHDAINLINNGKFTTSAYDILPFKHKQNTNHLKAHQWKSQAEPFR